MVNGRWLIEENRPALRLDDSLHCSVYPIHDIRRTIYEIWRQLTFPRIEYREIWLPPNLWAREDLNPQPSGYEPPALPLSYRPENSAYAEFGN